MEININIKKYLEKTKYSTRLIRPLRLDASKRKYYRISMGNNTAILVDSSLEKESLSNFQKMTNWLLSSGFSSPEIYDIDYEKGFSVMEDFGNAKFSNLFLKRSIEKKKIYTETIKLLIELSGKEVPSFLKPFSKNMLLKELELYLFWYKYYKKINNKTEIKEWNKIWIELLDKAMDDKLSSVVLRDFHIDNLFFLRKRIGIKKIGLIDFQDAVCGHPIYDLVSLLQDVRTNISNNKETELFNIYKEYKKESNQNLDISYLIFGTQRIIKIIGIFKRLELQKNKKMYLQFLPRAWSILKKNLQHPILKDLNSWFKNYGF